MRRGNIPNPRFVEKAIEEVMEDMAKQAKKLMTQPTKTWKNHKPVITVE